MAALMGAALAAALTGCAEDGQEPEATPSGPVPVAEVIRDHQYYYACGDEVLLLPDGRSFYPLVPANRTDIDETRYAAGWTIIDDHLVAVAPPGPGDDTGTLTIYEDGIARWRSDSGIEAWLTEEPQEYAWEC